MERFKDVELDSSRKSEADEMPQEGIVSASEGLQPSLLPKAFAERAIIMHDPGDKLPNEALRERLNAMSSEEKTAWVEYHRKLAILYDGPGGP